MYDCMAQEDAACRKEALVGLVDALEGVFKSRPDPDFPVGLKDAYESACNQLSRHAIATRPPMTIEDYGRHVVIPWDFFTE